MKDRGRPSMKELMTTPKKHQEENDDVPDIRMPNYIIKPPKFSCPLSPYIMWHHDFQYEECPIGDDQRDMSSCGKCPYKSNKIAYKGSKKEPQKEKKSTPQIVKKEKTAIPKIGKTYVSK